MEDLSVLATLNLSKICRTCLIEAEEMHSIFSELRQDYNLEEDPSFIYELLMNISSMRILEEDGLPTVICSNCMDLAQTSYKFQQQCNRSQAILEAYLVQTQDKDTDENKPIVEEFVELLDNDSLPLDQQTELDNVTTDEMEKLQESNESEINLDETAPENLGKSILDAAKIAATEDNVKLRRRLALKRMLSTVHSDNRKKSNTSVKLPYVVQYAENGEKTYACNVCERIYKHASSLKIHMRTHTLERPYVCTLCGKDFKQYGSLNYHMRSHTGEQPYGCKICGKRYKQSGTLTAHMRVHTGQRPFLCSVCGRGFRQAPDLGYHMRTHTKEKPYMCNICGKTMSMQCHLVQHMRTHTGERPFKCNECHKAFPSSTRLKRHAIIHTGLKPYTCEVCEKSFNRLSTLRVHSKIHTDERPHVCSVCGKGFIQAHALKAHILTHSTEGFNSNL